MVRLVPFQLFKKDAENPCFDLMQRKWFKLAWLSKFCSIANSALITFIAPLNRYSIEFLSGKITIREYQQKIDEINIKLDQKKRIFFPYPLKKSSEADFQCLVSLNRRLLMDRLRQLIRVSKANRHFSIFYMEYNKDLAASTHLPFLLSKRQMKRRFLHSQSTFGNVGSRLSTDDLNSFNTYLTLENVDQYADITTSLTRVPKSVKDLQIVDLIKILKNRTDGESIFRSVVESCFEVDRTIRVSIICLWIIVYGSKKHMVHTIWIILYEKILKCFFLVSHHSRGSDKFHIWIGIPSIGFTWKVGPCVEFVIWPCWNHSIRWRCSIW